MNQEQPSRYCGQNPCPDDCEEVAMIYREQQREKLRDIDPEWAEDYMHGSLSDD